MAYTKTDWQTGDTITAEKLNHLEDGVANGSLMITVTTSGSTKTLDKTWQEIYDASSQGVLVMCQERYDNDDTAKYVSTGLLVSAGRDGSEFYVAFMVRHEGAGEITLDNYMANSADAYPINGVD